MMAANLGQAFLGGAGIVPTLAQELAAGNFESRESFHDYIYSKLILGDQGGDKTSGVTSATTAGAINVNNQTGVVSGGVNTAVFPNTNLSASYPNSLPPAASASGGSVFSGPQAAGVPTHMINSGGTGILVNNIVNNSNNAANTANNLTAQNIAARGGFVTPSNQEASNTLNNVGGAGNTATPSQTTTTTPKSKKKSQQVMQNNQTQQMVAIQGQVEGEGVKVTMDSDTVGYYKIILRGHSCFGVEKTCCIVG